MVFVDYDLKLAVTESVVNYSVKWVVTEMRGHGTSTYTLHFAAHTNLQSGLEVIVTNHGKP